MVWLKIPVLVATLTDGNSQKELVVVGNAAAFQTFCTWLR